MPLRIGHRGAAGHAPENTLNSFEKAIALGVDYIELDVQRTKDGHLVVMHDKLVDRTTNGKGCLSAMTFEEIRALDAGSGQKIPKLEEVLHLADRRVGLVLEIISPAIAEQVCAYVGHSKFQGPIIYASFLHAELLRVRSVDRSAKTMALLEGVPVKPTSFAQDAEVSHVGLGLDSFTEPFLNALRAGGFQVFVYTANHPLDIQRLGSLAVDGIISDFPERIPE